MKQLNSIKNIIVSLFISTIITFSGLTLAGETKTLSQEQTIEAVKEIRTAAEKGNAEDQLNLGAFYEYGIDVPKDEKKAFYWYTKAANQGLAEAQYSLGLITFLRGGKNDAKQAFKWFGKAAEQGHPGAIELMKQYK